MSHSFTNLKYHIVFATKDRLPTIRPEHQPRIYTYIGGIVRGLGGVAFAVNGMEDHIHLLAGLGPSRSLAAAIGLIKSSSSAFLRSEISGMKYFAWGRGYGAFTVSESSLGNVIAYIERQKEHHQIRTWDQEFELFLHANKIELTQ